MTLRSKPQSKKRLLKVSDNLHILTKNLIAAPAKKLSKKEQKALEDAEFEKLMSEVPVVQAEQKKEESKKQETNVPAEGSSKNKKKKEKKKAKASEEAKTQDNANVEVKELTPEER